MRGGDDRTDGLFSYVSCEARVPVRHPLRPIRAMVDDALELLSPDFEGLYSKIGRPSILPKKLPRALLLQAFYSIRSAGLTWFFRVIGSVCLSTDVSGTVTTVLCLRCRPPASLSGKRKSATRGSATDSLLQNSWILTGTFCWSGSAR